MPSTTAFFHARGQRSRPARSFALVLVLGCLVFLSALVLAFLSGVTTELQSSQFYANGAQVKLLADSASGLAMGQIKDATRGVDASGTTLAWASQPGMIRTYGTNGQPAGYYKLYSWDKMIGSGAFDASQASEIPPADWTNSPAVYIDLNEPVYKKSLSSYVYPIVDPAATNTVQGFSIANAPATKLNAAPMPVKWLYVLQDGTLASSSGSGSAVTVAKASKSNPIVGRVAFWTDDDSCKVNINTAAGDVWFDSANPPAAGSPGNPGSFWDIPRFSSTYEKSYFASNQPAQAEYQRYPGHPATTYLSAVFTNLTATNLYQIAPRVAYGGSKGGSAVPAAPVTIDNDRLYASVDELLFATNRGTNPALTAKSVEQAKFFLTAHSRSPEVNLYNQPRVLIWPVSANTGAANRSAFDSLVAYCGTLNNSIYYFQRANAGSPTADLPTAPAATGVGRNRALISYLRGLTDKPVPGFGSAFVAKYPNDRDQILTEIFDYIRSANAQDTSAAPFSNTNKATVGQGQIVPIMDTVHSDQNSNTLRGFGRFPTIREAGFLFVGVGQTKGANASIPPYTSTGTPAYNNSIYPTQAPATSPGGVAIADGYTRVQAVFFANFFDPSQGWSSTTPDFQVQITGLNGLHWGPAGAGMGFQPTATLLVRKTTNQAAPVGIYGGYKGAALFVTSQGLNTAISTWIDLPTGGTFDFGGGNLQMKILDSAGTTTLQTINLTFRHSTFPVPGLAPSLADVGVPPGVPAITLDFRNFGGPSVTTTTPRTGSRFFGVTNSTYSTFARTWVARTDVVRTVEANTDPRLIAATAVVPASYFSPIEPQYDDTATPAAHGLFEALNSAGGYAFYGTMVGKLIPSAVYTTAMPTTFPVTNDGYTSSGTMADNLQPIFTDGTGAGGIDPVAFGMSSGVCVPANGVYAGTNQTGANLPNPPGDWDNGFSVVPDGAFINKADEGVSVAAGTPYYSNLNAYIGTGTTLFSPNRQIPSPVMFGSLPTGVNANRPWQTLLFQPDPGGVPQHIGAQSPADHLLLDLFTMPVVEPYPISDPLSIAGRVNMNYQIVPFTYITRSTGLRAVLRPEQILALSNSDSTAYKNSNLNLAGRRLFLDLDKTLTGFQTRFASGDIFRSASEICSLWLVPQGQTYAGMPAFWSTRRLTGDNSRERPYADIYPRLTTKSNTYTIHVRVQTLKKSAATDPASWIENNDAVTGEYRGSTTVERYIDTADTRLPDYATAANPPPIDTFYKFRVVETKQFTP